MWQNGQGKNIRVYGRNFEVIAITEFYEVFHSVYYAFCAESTRNELRRLVVSVCMHVSTREWFDQF
jgi:hypothetical protein